TTGTITAKEMSDPMILRNTISPKDDAVFADHYSGPVMPYKEMEKIFRTKYFKYVRSISSNDSNAAEKLGLAPSNFYRMCKELGIK
ncbi:MAG TPA: sigma-54-dependent Fis family transcriptional regulator, partial [Bacteroidota bacterium]|nr:sigma-54-dependent Fis family transcriptional regulator [Bacteroidota bacterium]